MYPSLKYIEEEHEVEWKISRHTEYLTISYRKKEAMPATSGSRAYVALWLRHTLRYSIRS